MLNTGDFPFSESSMSQGVRKISCTLAAGLRRLMSLLLACLFTLMHTCVFPCVCQHSWWQMASRLKGFSVSASHDCLQYCRPWLWKGIQFLQGWWAHLGQQSVKAIFNYLIVFRLFPSNCRSGKIDADWLSCFVIQLSDWAFKMRINFHVSVHRRAFIDKILCYFSEGCHINITSCGMLVVRYLVRSD